MKSQGGRKVALKSGPKAYLGELLLGDTRKEQSSSRSFFEGHTQRIDPSYLTKILDRLSDSPGQLSP